MAQYRVRKNQTLADIAKKMGVKNWLDLYRANKQTLIRNSQKIQREGTIINLPGTKNAPSKEIGAAIANTVNDPTRQNFIDKFGTEDELRPLAQFQRFADERVNPEAFRQAIASITEADRALSVSGGYRTGEGMAARTGLVNDLERQRKEQANEFVQNQKQLFNTWYNQEMDSYMRSKAPSGYQLSKFGIDIPGMGSQPAKLGQQFQYNPTTDFTKYLGYGNINKGLPSWYGSITDPNNGGNVIANSRSGYNWI